MVQQQQSRDDCMVSRTQADEVARMVLPGISMVHDIRGQVTHAAPPPIPVEHFLSEA